MRRSKKRIPLESCSSMLLSCKEWWFFKNASCQVPSGIFFFTHLWGTLWLKVHKRSPHKREFSCRTAFTMLNKACFFKRQQHILSSKGNLIIIYKMTILNNSISHLSTYVDLSYIPVWYFYRSVIHTCVVAHLKMVGLVKQQQSLSRSRKESDSDSTRGEFISRQ